MKTQYITTLNFLGLKRFSSNRYEGLCTHSPTPYSIQIKLEKSPNDMTVIFLFLSKERDRKPVYKNRKRKEERTVKIFWLDYLFDRVIISMLYRKEEEKK